ncbi:MAG: PP2C family protein-serine/threonine phosphatase [Chloroflexia bacterium]
MGFEFGVACDPGRRRGGDPNQDAVGLIPPDTSRGRPALLVVADGMGGHGGGATASRLVVEAMERCFRQAHHPADYRAFLEEGVREAHRAVRQHAAQHPDLSHMGSTVVAAVLAEERAWVVNVGDSRAYLLRQDGIRQLSRDHSWVGELARAGHLSPEEARTHPRRSRLTMAIAAHREEVHPFSTETALGAGEVLLLCSDGLWGVVPERLLWAVAGELPPQQAAEKLVSLANAHQGPDNISVLIARRPGPRWGVGEDETQPG